MGSPGPDPFLGVQPPGYGFWCKAPENFGGNGLEQPEFLGPREGPAPGWVSGWTLRAPQKTPVPHGPNHRRFSFHSVPWHAGPPGKVHRVDQLQPRSAAGDQHDAPVGRQLLCRGRRGRRWRQMAGSWGFILHYHIAIEVLNVGCTLGFQFFWHLRFFILFHCISVLRF